MEQQSQLPQLTQPSQLSQFPVWLHGHTIFNQLYAIQQLHQQQQLHQLQQLFCLQQSPFPFQQQPQLQQQPPAAIQAIKQPSYYKSPVSDEEVAAVIALSGMKRNRSVKKSDEQLFKANRVKRHIDKYLDPEKAEEELGKYVHGLVKILNDMVNNPYRLASCQRPDDTFLNCIPTHVLYKLPTFIKYQGMVFPPQLLVSDMLYKDAIGRAVLSITNLRKRVIIRFEKRGQRKRSNMFPRPATLEMKSTYDAERRRIESDAQSAHRSDGSDKSDNSDNV